MTSLCYRLSNREPFDPPFGVVRAAELASQAKKGFGYHSAGRYFSGASSNVSFSNGDGVLFDVPYYAAERGT
jgi:hypothetical protein